MPVLAADVRDQLADAPARPGDLDLPGEDLRLGAVRPFVAEDDPRATLVDDRDERALALVDLHGEADRSAAAPAVLRLRPRERDDRVAVALLGLEPVAPV